MSQKLDTDVKSMSHGERGAEIMRLRRLVRTVLTSQNNNACWINEVKLAAAVGCCPGVVNLNEKEFLRNCRLYHRRKARQGLVKA